MRFGGPFGPEATSELGSGGRRFKILGRENWH